MKLSKFGAKVAYRCGVLYMTCLLYTSLGYKIVTCKLGAFVREGPQDAERLQNIVPAIFPSHLVRETESETIEPAEIPIFLSLIHI